MSTRRSMESKGEQNTRIAAPIFYSWSDKRKARTSAPASCEKSTMRIYHWNVPGARWVCVWVRVRGHVSVEIRKCWPFPLKGECCEITYSRETDHISLVSNVLDKCLLSNDDNAIRLWLYTKWFRTQGFNVRWMLNRNEWCGEWWHRIE